MNKEDLKRIYKHMSKEELINILINERIKSDNYKETIDNLTKRRKNEKQLQDNWNTVKGYLNTLKGFYIYPNQLERRRVVNALLIKMEELEQGKLSERCDVK